MEINTRQMEALLQLQEQQAQLPHRSNNDGTGFQTILNQQMGLQQTPGAVPQDNVQATLYSQIMLGNTGDDHANDPDMAVLQAAFDDASGALDLWDTYAATLGASTANSALRDAYSLLQGIDSRVAHLRANPLASQNSELSGIINELEILSATEKFKFNRGDYLM